MTKSKKFAYNNGGHLQRSAIHEKEHLQKTLQGQYRSTSDKSEFTIRIDTHEMATLTYTKSTTKKGSIPVSVAYLKNMIGFGSFEKVV